MKNRFAIWYQKWIEPWIPSYAVCSLITCFLWNSIIYTGTQICMKHAYHYELSIPLDEKIPFVPEWIFVYVICFAFWAANYILITREGKEEWFRFATADMLSRVICGLFFVFLPTTTVRPEVTGTGFASWLVRSIYQLDLPTNLFPSVHCLVSWFCFIGIRKSKKVPRWYKVFSCVFACLVFASTQFTKQHYLLDVIGGVAIAELCYWISMHCNLYQKLEWIFGRLGQKIFGDYSYDG
ncbi:MAG: phosphatase PAP2 family protein [Lachnospiraceae bacterium]